MASRCLAHEELLGVKFDEMHLTLGGVLGAIGQHGLVFIIEQFFKDLAVVDTGGRGGGAEDELGFQVGLQMVLPSLVHFVVLLGPACFAVVVLARGIHKAGIHHTAFADDHAFAFEHLAEGFEELAAALTAFGFKALLETQIVLASGISSPMSRPRKLLKLMRSVICSRWGQR